MPQPTSQPRLQALALTGWTVVSVPLLAWACMQALPGLGIATTPAAALSAGGVILAASLLSFLPLAILAPRGLMPTVTGYFIGMGLRLLVALAGAALLVRWAGHPPMTVGLLMGILYMWTLMLELVFVSRYLRMLDVRPSIPPAATPALSEASS